MRPAFYRFEYRVAGQWARAAPQLVHFREMRVASWLDTYDF